MTPLYKQYENAAPLGVYPICSAGGLVILEMDDERALAAWSLGDGYKRVRHHKVNYTYTGRAYIRKGGTRYYFDQIMKTGGY